MLHALLHRFTVLLIPNHPMLLFFLEVESSE